MKFELHAPYQPTGDQPEAIQKLVEGIQKDYQDQVLLGATGTGKTFAIAALIEKIQKTTLVMAHNKTLAAQLYAEFKEFFPDNAVEYFVSYYDYYQPEAYVPRHDLYIEKDADINEEIERLRLEHFDSDGTALRSAHLVAALGENVGNQIENVFLVVDDENLGALRRHGLTFFEGLAR